MVSEFDGGVEREMYGAACSAILGLAGKGMASIIVSM
jgi:hypothetical protein